MRPKSRLRVDIEKLGLGETYEENRADVTKYWQAQCISFNVSKDENRRFNVQYDKDIEILRIERVE